MTLEEKIRVFERALMEIAERPEVDQQDHTDWGNADDSFSHGYEVGQGRLGSIARMALEKVGVPERLQMSKPREIRILNNQIENIIEGGAISWEEGWVKFREVTAQDEAKDDALSEARKILHAYGAISPEITKIDAATSQWFQKFGYLIPAFYDPEGTTTDG